MSFPVPCQPPAPSLPANGAGTALRWRLPGAPHQSGRVPSQPSAASPRRLIELHSPDSRNTLILRCKDTATAHSWFTALHANIAALLPQVLAELNTMLGTGGAAAGGREVKHIAWLAEQVRVLSPTEALLAPWCREWGAWVPATPAAPCPSPWPRVSRRRGWTAGGSSGGPCSWR